MRTTTSKQDNKATVQPNRKKNNGMKQQQANGGKKMKTANTPTNRANAKKIAFKSCFYTLSSLGTIFCGAWACPTSMGIGVSLVLIGTILFAESGLQMR
jgi:hypothetical protein